MQGNAEIWLSGTSVTVSRLSAYRDTCIFNGRPVAVAAVDARRGLHEENTAEVTNVVWSPK